LPVRVSRSLMIRVPRRRMRTRRVVVTRYARAPRVVRRATPKILIRAGREDRTRTRMYLRRPTLRRLALTTEARATGRLAAALRLAAS
jgi:hypothetical protein